VIFASTARDFLCVFRLSVSLEPLVVMDREEGSAQLHLAKRLKEAVLKGQPSAYGLAEVGKALEEGRVNHLFLSSSFALPQMICKKCHFIHQEGKTCPTCGGQMQALSLEGLYEKAERTGAEVVLA
jgi:peptide subunit release factor 1 (eRF1)